ncbi:unnamed protein product [Calicophoron daubneyi]|uniref:CSC1-like protein 2 n=1 Tax=Calicophoron daubneyi TaxID=300641 RepID=A0AAV2T292_CALDB
MDDRPICERIITYNNNTAVIPGYEGIPQNLLVNSVAWAILLLLFSLLRKVAWDYGRIALTKPRKNQWTSLFYSEVRPLSNDDDSVEGMDVAYATHDSGACSWVRTYFTLRNSDLEKKAGIDAVQYLRFQLYLIIYTAITMVLCLVVVLPLNMKGNLKSPDLQQFGVTTISNIAGESATLWGHVILGFVFFLLAFLLMQHFSRQLRSEAKQARTTSYQTLMISGISRSHCQRDLLLRHFREAFPACEVDDVQVCYDIRQLVKWDNRWESSKAALNYSRRKLDLTGKRPIMVPRCCGWTCAKLYRAGYCHGCFARKPIRGRVVTDTESQGSGSNQMMPDEVVRSGQCICSSCCMCPAPVDAVEYYSKESEYLKNRIEEEGVKAVRTKIGIAFVTFTSVEAADVVHRSYNRYCGCLRGQLKSSVSAVLRSHAWTVQFAPIPSNIIWPNLAVTRTVWWMRAISINAVVFIVVFFLTTPTYVLNLVSKLRLLERLQITNPLIIQFLPSIILWSVSAFLPFLVFNSDRLVGHWTRSGLHLTVMAKTFTLLLLMVLLLPSLGLTSIPALLQWLFPEMRLIPLVPGDKNASTLSPSYNISSTVSSVISTFTAVSSNWTYNESATATTTSTPITVTTPQIPLGPQSFQWQCVFMPDNGAFFVNYVITSAFIGTAMELVRVPELIVYACRILCVRSQAEKAGVRKASQWEFDFGLYYAWTLCVFAVISAYSILCPLITPFGLVYLIFRYLVERYNLFFAYLPSRIDSRIHCLAMNFMLLAVLLLQLNLFMFVALRRGAIGSALSIASLSGLVISAFFWIMAVVLGWVYVGSAPNKRLGMDRFGPVLPLDVTVARQGDRNQWERIEERQSPEYHVPERSTVETDGINRASSHIDQLKLALGPPTEEVIRNPTEVALNRPLSSGTTHALTTPVGEHPLLRAQHRYSLPDYSDTQFIAPILLSFVQEAEHLSETTSVNERD